MKCKIVSTTDPPANKSNRLTRTSSASRTIKPSTSSSHGNNNFKIKLKHGYSPNRSSNSNMHGCRTQTRSSTSSATSTSRGNSRNHGNTTTTPTTATTAAAATTTSSKESAKEMKKSKDSGDHRCNCICANCGLFIDDSGPIDKHRHDVSLIREPINLGTKNVRQILQCVHNGTPEIKDIILNECNIIYECRICRNLFRSLANLLSHKRYYCKDHKCESMLLFDDKHLTRGLPEEDDDFILANFQSNVPIEPENVTKRANNKTKSDLHTPPPPPTTTTTKARNRRKQETTFAGPIDHRDEPSPLLINSVQESKPSTADEIDYCIVTKKVKPEVVASKRKHLESCVNKLLHEKSSPKVDQLTIPQADDEIDGIKSFFKNSEEKNESTIVKESMNIDDVPNNSQNEQRSTLSIISPNGKIEDNPVKEIVNSISTSSINATTTTATLCNTSTIKTITTPIVKTSTTCVVFNIDENANHPVAGEESESNIQEIVSYPQSISSLVSDDGDCSHMSETFPSEVNSEMDNESIDVDEDIITINNKELFNATRHMIQVHRKGKTQVKFLREAVKRRAYPEVKSDENGEETVKDEDELIDNPIAEQPPMENLEEEDEEEEGEGDDENDEEDDSEDKVNPDNPFNLKAVPVIVKVGKNLKRKNCDTLKEEYKLSSSSSSSSTSSSSVKCSSASSTEAIKLTINHKQNNESEVNQLTDLRSKSSLEIDNKKETGTNSSNQEKVRRVNPIIFSCINNCGEYFIKVDSKNQHEKKCSKPDDDNDDEQDDDQEKSNYNLTTDSTSHNHHHHHHHHHRSRDSLDLTIITESIYKELEKVGNLITRRCNHCPDLQFKTKSLLIQHLIVHIGYEVLKCKKCAYQTLNRTEMDNHLGSAHGTPEILRGRQIVNLSTSLANDTNGSIAKKISSRVELTEDSQESTRGNVDETKGSSEKSNSSSIVLHLRPKLSRSRKKKKIYEIVGD